MINDFCYGCKVLIDTIDSQLQNINNKNALLSLMKDGCDIINASNVRFSFNFNRIFV